MCKVRRTQKGDLLLELNSSGKDIPERFNEVIETSLDGCVEVRTHKDEIIILCRDLDDITTKQEICESLRKVLDMPSLNESIIRSIWKSYGGTQTAKISLPAAARKAIEFNKIKIGWSICRIREMVPLTKCFRCFEFGHTSRYCQSLVDRSRQCIKCGVEGHIAKDCQGELCCML